MKMVNEKSLLGCTVYYTTSQRRQASGFSRYAASAQVRSITLRCRVTKQNGSIVTIQPYESHPDYDGKELVVSASQLAYNAREDRVKTVEAGDVSGEVGVWSEWR
jgi:hypothetical protein